MKTAELTGAMLDYWIAKAEGHELLNHNPQLMPSGVFCAWHEEDGTSRSIFYSPSTDWAQGGPIIEREQMHGGPSGTSPDGVSNWFFQCYRKDSNGAHIPYPASGSGPTPLVAAMRAFVASKFGDEVPEIAG
jgi:hypothetical protein